MELTPRMRTNFVYVPQGNTLLSGTIRENLLLGKTDATDEELRFALHEACADFVFDLPNSWKRPVPNRVGGSARGKPNASALPVPCCATEASCFLTRQHRPLTLKPNGSCWATSCRDTTKL